MDLTNLTWRKSSYTGSNGGDCVELAGLTWRKASRSGENGGNCIELADAAGAVADAVAVRDSKDPEGPVLLVTGAALRAAVHAALTTR
ncbi:DUF397 domain-containing protein [Actinomadura sp. LD22]|uniref:DUF397 domain-containing protein n=1 Tax=Actinomadura physcomitrii TaxID=2650748 RepID=A0A6I4MJU5_9ACTN|nr:DUF397 domain-containing protein [Actinomadura physcomitrii]MWA04267.1 DUF397 domain-containing protein [Actinomadura physcomitrii]MWA05897.1 DUF397 domain-containing protein [Actinomadura physcomitrii]